MKIYRNFFDFFCVFIEIWFDVSKKERSDKILIYKDRKKTKKNKSKPQIVPKDIKKTNRQTDTHTDNRRKTLKMQKFLITRQTGKRHKKHQRFKQFL